MKILDIVPEKINITFSLNSDEIYLLDKALKMSTLNYNSNNPEDVKVKTFFIDEFSNIISKLKSEILEVEH